MYGYEIVAISLAELIRATLSDTYQKVGHTVYDSASPSNAIAHAGSQPGPCILLSVIRNMSFMIVSIGTPVRHVRL